MSKKRSGSDKRIEQELSILYKISQAMAHQHDITMLLNEVLDVLELDMGLSRGTLALRRPEADICEIEASRGLSPDEKKRGRYRLGEGITGKVAKSGKPSYGSDISRDPNFLDRTKTRKRDPRRTDPDSKSRTGHR